MSARILILTQPGDVHAFAVEEALRQKGAEPVIWLTSDFPMIAEETVLFERGEARMALTGPGFAVRGAGPRFDTIWRRRPAHVIDPQRLHPADIRFASRECVLFRKGLFHLLDAGEFWINPFEAAVRANLKLLQLKLALDIGLAIPDSLFGNDPQEIRAFIRRHGGRVVYKPLRGTAWTGSESSWMTYTATVTEEMLVGDDVLRLTPGIFQEVVEKEYELRITAMGRRMLGVRIFSQESEAGRLDWRKAYDELRMEPYHVPAWLAERCHKLLQRLGLVFGCFDFIVTPQGTHVFLEINEMGQFLFLEYYTDLPVLDAFAEFLLQRRLDFAWKPKEASVRASQVVPLAERTLKDLAPRHAIPPQDAEWEETPGEAPATQP